MVFSSCSAKQNCRCFETYCFCSDILRYGKLHVDISAGLGSKSPTKHPSNHRARDDLRPGYIVWKLRVCGLLELGSFFGDGKKC